MGVCPTRFTDVVHGKHSESLKMNTHPQIDHLMAGGLTPSNPEPTIAPVTPTTQRPWSE